MEFDYFNKQVRVNDNSSSNMDGDLEENISSISKQKSMNKSQRRLLAHHNSYNSYNSGITDGNNSYGADKLKKLNSGNKGSINNDAYQNMTVDKGLFRRKPHVKHANSRNTSAVMNSGNFSDDDAATNGYHEDSNNENLNNKEKPKGKGFSLFSFNDNHINRRTVNGTKQIYPADISKLDSTDELIPDVVKQKNPKDSDAIIAQILRDHHIDDSGVRLDINGNIISDENVLVDHKNDEAKDLELSQSTIQSGSQEMKFLRYPSTLSYPSNLSRGKSKGEKSIRLVLFIVLLLNPFDFEVLRFQQGIIDKYNDFRSEQSQVLKRWKENVMSRSRGRKHLRIDSNDEDEENNQQYDDDTVEVRP